MNYVSLGENQITLFCIWVKKSHLGENQKVDFGQKQIRLYKTINTSELPYYDS